MVRVRRSVLGRAMLLAVAVVVTVPAVAGAASRCAPADRELLAQASARADVVRARGTAQAADVDGVVSRARGACGAARFALAVAAASDRLGAVPVGSRARVVGIDLVSVAAHDDSTAWRLDTVRVANRLAAARSEEAALVQRRVLLGAGHGARTVLWSDDPTRATWSAQRQIAVTGALMRSASRGGTARARVDHRLAHRSIGAFLLRGPRRALTTQPVSLATRDVGALDGLARRYGDAASRRAAVLLAGDLQRTIATSSPTRSAWSRTRGSWSTAVEHRAIVGASLRLEHVRSTGSSRSVARRLARSLVTPPTASITGIPGAAFYPRPVDGVRDVATVRIATDRPGRARLILYGAGGAVAAVVTTPTEPGAVHIDWNGANASGAALPPGSYRYRVAVSDPLGRTIVLPGFATFDIAVDVTPPVVRSASAAYRRSAGVLIASWKVDEPHAPTISTSVTLTRGPSWTRTIRLPGELTAATTRSKLRLGRGTYGVVFTFVDGAGNRARSAPGTIVIS